MEEPAYEPDVSQSDQHNGLGEPNGFERTVSATTSENIHHKMQWGSVWVATIIMFVVAVQFSIYFSSLWPYMSMIDPTATQTFYGFTLAAYSLGQMIASPVFGYINNKLKRARPVIALGVVSSIAGNLIYMFTEAVPHNRKWVIVIGRFVAGIGGGVLGTVRGFLATTSTVEHRARTIAIGTAALSLGITAGPAIQAAAVPIGYPGLVRGPIHFSEYTAPAYISVAAALILLGFLFTIFKENYIGIDERKKENPFHYVPKSDMRAALLCIFCWFAMFFTITNSETVESPYTMAVFQWNNGEAVQYNSYIMAVSSFISFVMYAFYAMYGKKINERLAVNIGLCLLFAFYVITFPWPFFPGHLHFKSAPTEPPNITLTTPLSSSQSTTGTYSTSTTGAPYVDKGCDLDMQWCHYTPALPLPVYLAAYPLLSIGFPTCNVAISTLFSKVLGPRRQGFMQSLMIMAGSTARLLGPILISWLFDQYGPRIAWTMTGSVVGLCSCGLLLEFNRLVPLKMRPKLKFGQKLRYDGGSLYRL